MAGGRVSPRNENFSVKCKRNQKSFEISDFNYSNPSVNDECSISNCDPQSSERVTTADLISAVGYAWSCAKKPLSILLPKSKATCESEVIREGDILHYSTNEVASHISIQLVEENQDCSRVKQKTSRPRLCFRTSSFWSLLLTKSMVIDESSMEDCLLSMRIPSNFGNTYNWMSRVALYKPRDCLNSVDIDNKTRTDNYDNCCPVADESSSIHSLTTEVSVSKPEIVEPLDLCSSISSDVVADKSCSFQSSTEGVSISKPETLEYLDLSSKKAASSELKPSTDIDLLGTRKPQYELALAKQEHAFAGAMAGISVSLCLHPVDTVKTVIQSCHTSQKPLHYVGRSIIAERGVLGLYRGITSNIVSSAPISALYTFTYESVKKCLLPLLPKENHSFVHCTAGGCASIATSLIFTPSERIKQQMQISSHYRNCWTALIQILQKGGLPSLYAGWGAVICRNVPHSVIKFYTYENMKQFLLPSVQWNAQANILTTLVCGGLAGSTASLFTTPFDVVKTRLQTQIPGSINKHSGVLITLNEIWKLEGLKGVYRGLTPRLVMYMIQGALFFASYESFKKLFEN